MAHQPPTSPGVFSTPPLSRPARLRPNIQIWVGIKHDFVTAHWEDSNSELTTISFTRFNKETQEYFMVPKDPATDRLNTQTVVSNFLYSASALNKEMPVFFRFKISLSRPRQVFPAPSSRVRGWTALKMWEEKFNQTSHFQFLPWGTASLASVLFITCWLSQSAQFVTQMSRGQKLNTQMKEK